MKILHIGGDSQKEAEEYNSLPKDTPIVLLIHAEWCGHCRAFKPVWEEMERELSTIPDNMVLASVEEKGLPMVQHEHTANFSGFPTIRFIQNGTIHEHEGSRNKEELMKKIKTMITSQTKPKKVTKKIGKRTPKKGGMEEDMGVMTGGSQCGMSGGSQCMMTGGCSCMGGSKGGRRMSCGKAGCRWCGSGRRTHKRGVKKHSQIGCGGSKRRTHRTRRHHRKH